MAAETRNNLKTKWVLGYTPTQADYAEFFDSFYNILDDETEAAFEAWLATDPLAGFITSETDPIFTQWLSDTPPLYSETDPIVGAIDGIVKANGVGAISAAIKMTDYVSPFGIYQAVAWLPNHAYAVGDLFYASEEGDILSYNIVHTSFTSDAAYNLTGKESANSYTWYLQYPAESDPVFETWLSTTPPAYPEDIPDITGLLDETAHDLLDHAGLIGIPSIYGNFDATIGAGGDYEDIAAAQTAGKYRLKAVGNITVATNLTYTNNILVDLAGFTIAFSTYNAAFSAGSLTIINGTITFAHLSGATNILFVGSTRLNLFVNNCTITNSSTANGCGIAAGGTFTNCSVSVGNYAELGFGNSGGAFNGTLFNINLTGGGASCARPIYDRQNTNLASLIQNIYAVGNFSDFRFSSCKDVFIDSSGACTIIQETGNGVIDNLVDLRATRTVSVSLTGKILNSKFLNLTIGTATQPTVTNCNLTGTVILGSNNVILSQNMVTGTTTINSDYNKLHNNILTGLVTLSSGAEYNVISGNTMTGGLTDSSASTTNAIKDNT